MPSIGGFWSYAHADDDNDGGRILALAQRLKQEYGLLTGEELELFIDQRELLWGDDWRDRITEALERVTFFIPVITPTYFLRPECRKELLRFARQAKEQDALQLILPIYYIEVPEIEDPGEPADEAMAIVKPLQREDLRELRLEDESHAEHRRLVNKLAQRLIRIARDLEKPASARPAEPPEPGTPTGTTGPSPPGGGFGGPAAADDVETKPAPEEDGVLERLASGEEALGQLTGAIENLSDDVQTLGRLTEEAGTEIERNDASGKPTFASRLAIARKLAEELRQPADDIEAHAQDYVSLLFRVDPLVQTILDGIATQEAPDHDAQSLMRSILEMADNSRESMKQTQGLVGIIEENANFSRELRQPLRQFQVSLRNVIDAQPVVDEWARRIKEIRSVVSSQSAAEHGPEP